MLKQSCVAGLLVTSAIYPASQALADADLYNITSDVASGETKTYAHNRDGSDATEYQGSTTVKNGGTLILDGVQAPTIMNGSTITNTGLSILGNGIVQVNKSTNGTIIGGLTSLSGNRPNLADATGRLQLDGDLTITGAGSSNTNQQTNVTTYTNANSYAGTISGTGNLTIASAFPTSENVNAGNDVTNLTLNADHYSGNINVQSPITFGDGINSDQFFNKFQGKIIINSAYNNDLTFNNTGITNVDMAEFDSSKTSIPATDYLPAAPGVITVNNLSSESGIQFSGDNSSLGIQHGTSQSNPTPPTAGISITGTIGLIQTGYGQWSPTYIGGFINTQGTPYNGGSLHVTSSYSNNAGINIIDGSLVRGAIANEANETDSIQRGQITVDKIFYLAGSGATAPTQFDWNLSPKNTNYGKFDDPIKVGALFFAPGNDFFQVNNKTFGSSIEDSPVPFFVTSSSTASMQNSMQTSYSVTGKNVDDNKKINPGVYRIFRYSNPLLSPLSNLKPVIDTVTDASAGTVNAGLNLQLMSTTAPSSSQGTGVSNIKTLNARDSSLTGDVNLLASHNSAYGLFWSGSGSHTWNGSDNNWQALDQNTQLVSSSTNTTWDNNTSTDTANNTVGRDAYFLNDVSGTDGKITVSSSASNPLKVGNIFFANHNGEYTLTSLQSDGQRSGSIYLQNADTYIAVGSTNAAHDDVNLKAQIDAVLDDSQVSGGSTLTKDGAGTLILSQDNTYRGTTTIDAGTLQLGDGGTSGSIKSTEIDIQRYGALAIDHQDNFDLSQALTIKSIGGAGEIDQKGPGITNLKGDASGFTGDVNVTNGTLNIENSLGTNNGNTNPTSSTGPVNVTVSTGGWLTGDSAGKIGGKVTVEDGTIGAVDRANPPTGNTTNATSDGSTAQSMTVDGNLVMGAGSTLATSLTADSNGKLMASLLNVTGSAYLSDAKLSFINSDYVNKVAAQLLQVNQTVTVLKAGGGLYLGTEGSTTKLAADNVKYGIDAPASSNTSLFTTATYDVSADDTTLAVTLSRNSTNFGDYGQTHSEISTGRALNNVSQNNEIYQAFSKITDPGMARQALNNLSGEIHASVRTGLIQDSYMIRNAVLNRMDNVGCEFGKNGQGTYDVQTHQKDNVCNSSHTVLWGQAYGSIGSNGGDGNAATMHHNTAGFIIGADTPFRGSNWRAGGFVSYGHSMFNVGQGRSSSANSNNLSVGGYGSTHWGALNLRLGASYSWNMINTRRQIAVGAVGGRATSSYLGGTAQGFAELGYKMHAGRTVFEPFANVAYVNMQTNGFRERGTAAALRGRNEDTGVTFSTFGFRAASRFNIGKAVFMPHVMGAYRHAFGNTGSGIRQSFASGSSEMGVNGVLLSRNAAVIDTGITARLTNRIDLDVSYIGQYGNHSMDSGATGSFKFRF